MHEHHKNGPRYRNKRKRVGDGVGDTIQFPFYKSKKCCAFHPKVIFSESKQSGFTVGGTIFIILGMHLPPSPHDLWKKDEEEERRESIIRMGMNKTLLGE